ncbi:MAG: ATP-binding protein [Syntrophobacteraceae bacterium]
MGLKAKILLGYGIAFTFMGMVIAWAVVNLVSLGKATDAVLRENYWSILAAENMVGELERQDSGTLLALLGDPSTGMAQFHASEGLFLQWLARAKDNITIPGEGELVQTIETAYGHYRMQGAAVAGRTHAGSSAVDLALAMYRESIYPAFAKVRETCVRLRDLNEQTMYAASGRADRIARRAIWSTISVSGAALALALLFSLLLAERIARPLQRFVEACRQISRGDYAVAVPVETRDELGRLAGELNQMASQLAHYHALNIEEILSEKTKSDAILSSIEDGLVVFDTDLKVTGINPAARRMLNLEHAGVGTLRCPDIPGGSELCGLVRQTVATGDPPSLPEERRIITLTEGERASHYLFAVTPIRVKDSTPAGIVLSLKDVTRLKEVERLKSEFVMAASHELRTPLTSIAMSIGLLKEHAVGSLPERDASLLQAAQEEVDRMKALVNDLLDLSRIEAGRIDLEFESVPVRNLFQHVDAVFRAQVREKGATFSVDPPEEPLRIRADSTKITWVLTNLISNGLRYVAKGGHIGISAHRVGSAAHISVRDDGPGIPLEYQTRIFQKFVQVKGRETGGSGLGLAICKEIVRAHGGTIWVESSPGQGSTFTFTVPTAE